jgi:hypothetical protein
VSSETNGVKKVYAIVTLVGTLGGFLLASGLFRASMPNIEEEFDKAVTRLELKIDEVKDDKDKSIDAVNRRFSDLDRRQEELLKITTELAVTVTVNTRDNARMLQEIDAIKVRLRALENNRNQP